ncbi:MAG: hypothetical protein WA840_10195 [Caulobacteraceae bacterium]
MSDTSIESPPDAHGPEEKPSLAWAHLGQLMVWAKTIDVIANRRERKRLARELMLLADRCDGPDFSSDMHKAAERLIRPAAQLLEIDRG